MVEHDHGTVIHRLLAVVAIASGIACGVSGAASAPASAVVASSPSPTPSRTPEVTKPPFSQPPLPAPTYAKWGIDRTGSADRPYFFELYYDGGATSFRILDATDRVVLRLPIAGSGIFGAEACLVSARPPGKTDNATWISIDEVAYQDLVAHAMSYRVEVDTIGHGTITLPLGDTGCRR